MHAVMNKMIQPIEGLMHLFFPNCCEGCGSELIQNRHKLCLSCWSQLPLTRFEWHPNNPVERIFWGRIPLLGASSHLYFTKESLLQHLMHQFKYKGAQELGLELGRSMGRSIQESNRFSNISGLIPLPLHPSRERKRGYNQARVLCEGLSEETGIPVFNNLIIRNTATITQTHKSRVERWQNMVGKFSIPNPRLLQNKDWLLVDDVITTGATLEACAAGILQVPGARLGIASLAYTNK
ncbi:ComF family protein [Paraflavitalea sp. sgz302555]|uniref:ComF family protein n=2 Tax=unclassified Paraflavitalea TaxID=2798305 RepID=UPI003D34223A